MKIDPHVHCRDGKQAYKATIAGVMALAREQGVDIIFDMPNTDPPITRESDVRERVMLVPRERLRDYYLYIGATADENQLEEAVRCYNNYRVVAGIKLFAGKSVGDLAVTEPEQQRKVYNILAGLGYEGVLAVHCEKEAFIDNSVFVPHQPATHGYARPPIAEIESIKDQIMFAKESGFLGTLHICHVSLPESVESVNNAREEIKISCGVTPHHILFSSQNLKDNLGLLYKMNPPLRSPNSVGELRKQLKAGLIDWIETDHAPHAEHEKLNSPYLSGHPSLRLYRHFVEAFLPFELGIGKDEINRITFHNIIKAFEEKLKYHPNIFI
jgi:dihydroorotase